MIYFSFQEILFSVVASLIYGLGFGSCYHLLSVFGRMLKALLSLPREALFYRGSIFCVERRKGEARGFLSDLSGNIKVFFFTVLFVVGYILLSYLTLDGELRLYTLALSALGFLSSVLLKIPLLKLVDALFFVWKLFVILLRFLCYPLRFAARFLIDLLYRQARKIEPYIPRLGSPDAISARTIRKTAGKEKGLEKRKIKK